VVGLSCVQILSKRLGSWVEVTTTAVEKTRAAFISCLAFENVRFRMDKGLSTTKPTASAPSFSAVFTSSNRVRPQIFTRIFHHLGEHEFTYFALPVIS